MVHTKQFGVPFFKNPHEYPIGASRPGGGTINVAPGDYLIGEEFRHNVNPELLKEYKGNISEAVLRKIHDPKGVIANRLLALAEEKEEKQQKTKEQKAAEKEAAEKKAADEAAKKKAAETGGGSEDVDDGDEEGEDILEIDEVGEFNQEELIAWFKEGNGQEISKGELKDCADFLGLATTGNKKTLLKRLQRA